MLILRGFDAHGDIGYGRDGRRLVLSYQRPLLSFTTYIRLSLSIYLCSVIFTFCDIHFPSLYSSAPRDDWRSRPW